MLYHRLGGFRAARCSGTDIKVGIAVLHGLPSGTSLVSVTREFCLYCGGAGCERRKMIRIKRVARTYRISAGTRINIVSGNFSIRFAGFCKNRPQIA